LSKWKAYDKQTDRQIGI